MSVLGLAVLTACAPEARPPERTPDSLVSPLWASTLMTHSRINHASAALLDGRAIVCGGNQFEDDGLLFLRTCETYAPRGAGTAWKPGTWPDLDPARIGHTLTTLPDGSVLVAGGMAPDGTTLSAVRLGTSQGWAEQPEDLQPRYGHTASLLEDGSVLFVGGATLVDAEYTYAETIQRRTPSGEWHEEGVFRGFSHTATVLAGGNKVLLVGGVGLDGLPLESDPVLYTAPSGAQPATLQPLNAPDELHRYLHTATLLENGDVLVMGGQGTRQRTTPYRFDVSLQSFEELDPEPNAPAIRTEHVTAALGRYVVVAGGAVTASATGHVVVYDSDANVNQPHWFELPPLNVARSGATITTLGDGSLLVAGGIADLTLVTTAELLELRALGEPCAGADQACITGYCVDGVCCNRACSGACEACDATGSVGTCSPIDGSPRVGHPSCGAGAECVAGECASSCTKSAPCPQGRECMEGRCVSKGRAGAPCSAVEDCKPGLFCADSVCCEAQCDGPCEACNGAGRCAPVTRTAEGHPECPDSGDSGCEARCDGASRECTVPVGAQCGEPSCNDDAAEQLSVGTCSANGRCERTVSSCDGYACDEAACKGACSSEDDCLSGYRCAEGRCVLEGEETPGPVPVSSPTEGGAGGESPITGSGGQAAGAQGDPEREGGAAGAPRECRLSSDCAAGWYCDTERGTCRKPKPRNSEMGCGVARTEASRGSWVRLIALASAAWLAAARRRATPWQTRS